MKKSILFHLLFLTAFIILTAGAAFSYTVKNGPEYSRKQAEFVPGLNGAGRKVSPPQFNGKNIGRFYGMIKAAMNYEKKHGGIHKKTVLKDLKMELNPKNFGHFPFIPIGSFDGKLKKTGTIKAVFGISGNNPQNLLEMLGNINFMLRYARFRHEKEKIAVVIYGAMARLIMTAPSFVYGAMSDYYKGVKFYICYNALMINGFVASNLPRYIKTVPMGTLEIYLLRKEGYMYFTNP